MFADAINLVGNYTRPILSISREYKNQSIIPGSATLFFVNDEGCAITCKHVAEIIIEAEEINKKYAQFKEERAKNKKDSHYRNELKKLEKKYGYRSGIIVETKNTFYDCIDSVSEINYVLHPTYDLAIIQFKGFSQKLYSGHAVFAKDGDRTQPGDFLCRLGYPFPEFTGFLYDSINETIDWDLNGNLSTPRFPIEGMITRYISGQNGEISGYEISTPGLRGQSGGPLFSKEGVVYGVQSKTNHLHLGFDVDGKNTISDSKKQIMNTQSFLHVGECVHVSIIKEFLSDNHIRYYIGDCPQNEETVD